MTREEQIEIFQKEWVKLAIQINHRYGENSFKEDIKWADEHPDSKHIYTKQQLIDMGFAFTTNGDIVTPDQLNEDLKKYLEYQKQKFINKLKKWLELETDWNMEYIEDGRNPNYGKIDELISHLNK